jgi:hypothetical protein
MVTGSILYDFIGFFQFTYSFQPHYALEPVTEMSTISRKIMFLGSRGSAGA